MTTKLPPDFIATVKALGTTVNSNESEWIYMPHWMRVIGPDEVEIVSFESLPEHLRAALKQRKK